MFSLFNKLNYEKRNAHIKAVGTTEYSEMTKLMV